MIWLYLGLRACPKLSIVVLFDDLPDHANDNDQLPPRLGS